MSDVPFEDEPEDAWDPDDPLPVLVDNLRRRVDLLNMVTTRALIRLRDLGDDLEHVRARIEDEV